MDQPNQPVLQNQEELLLTLIHTILNTEDNNKRNQAEATLRTLMAHTPDQAFVIFLNLLYSQHATYEESNMQSFMKDAKQFILLQIEKFLCKKAKHPYFYIWPKLQPQTQENIKKGLFKLLDGQIIDKLRKNLAQTTGRLAANLIVQNDSVWPQFKLQILDFLQQRTDYETECAFYMLQGFYEEEPQNFKAILKYPYRYFQIGFDLSMQMEATPQEQLVLIACLDSFSSYLMVLPYEEQTQFMDLIPKIMRSVQLLLRQHKKKGLYSLADMMNYQPKFFKSHFDQLIICLHQWFQSDFTRKSLKITIIQILVDYCQRMTSVFRNNQKNVQILIYMVVDEMSRMRYNDQKSWAQPQDGFQQKDNDVQDQKDLNIALYSLIKVIRAIGGDSTLRCILTSADHLLALNNRYSVFFRLMILSQIGQFFTKITEIQHFLDEAKRQLDNSDPLIRYAALHLIGQFADDFKHSFGRKYGESLYNILGNQLYIEKVPRVLSHTLAAFVNVVQHLNKEVVQSTYQIVISHLFDLTSHNTCIVKQAALTSISTFIYLIRDSFIPFVPTLFNKCFLILQHQQYQYPCFDILKSRAIQTIRSAIDYINQTQIQKYVAQLVPFMYEFTQENTNNKSTIGSIFSLWKVLSQTFGYQLQTYIKSQYPSLIPSLISNVQLTLADALNTQNQDQLKNYQTEDIIQGLQMLAAFCRQFLCIADSQDYLMRVSTIMTRCVKKFPNQKVNQISLQSLPQLFHHVIDKQTKIMFADNFVEMILQQAQNHPQQSFSYVKIKTIRLILRQVKQMFRTQEELKFFTNRLIQIMKNCEANKIAISDDKADLDEDEWQQIQGQLECDKLTQKQLAELFGNIMQFYERRAEYFARELIYEIINPVFKQQKQDISTILIAILIIDDIIDNYNWPVISELEDLEINLNIYTLSLNCEIRQAASFGLGILAEKTPIQFRSPQNAKRHLETLRSVISYKKKTTQTLSKFQSCRDNVISAMGKIMASHLHLMDLQQDIHTWLYYLPLQYDKGESFIQTRFLVHLILNLPELLFENCSLEKYILLMTIFGNILTSRLLQREMGPQIQISILKIQNLPNYVNNRQLIEGSLSNQMSTAINRHLSQQW